MTIASVPKLFEPISPIEIALYAQLKTLLSKVERRIRVSGQQMENEVRGGFLKWFLVEAISSSDMPIVDVEIRRVIVKDALDLENTKVDLLLRFDSCIFSQPINLSDAVISGFEMVGGSAPEISADRLTIRGSMRLHERYPPDPVTGPRLGKLRLCGADIRGNLDLRGCTLGFTDHVGGDDSAAEIGDYDLDESPDHAADNDSAAEIGDQDPDESPPLFADGLKVHGNVLLSGGFRSVGEIRLNGSSIDRNLDCSGASLYNPRGYSLSAAGARIKGSAYFSETPRWITYPKKSGFISKGTLRLEGAAIEGNLTCSAGQFFATAFISEKANPRESDIDAIFADGLRVGSDILFDQGELFEDRFVAHGCISLINARIGGDFSCKRAIFNFPGEEPLIADGIVVEGTTYLDDVRTDGILRFVQANPKQGLYINHATFDTTKSCKSWSNSKDNLARNHPVGCTHLKPRLVVRFGGKISKK